MKAIKFKGANASFTNPSGEQIPAFMSKDKLGTMVCGYRLSFLERMYILFWGKIWFSQITANASLRPFIITINKNEVLQRAPAASPGRVVNLPSKNKNKHADPTLN